MTKWSNQGAKARMLGRQNERNSSYVSLANTSIFGFCFMSVCLMKSNCYSLIYSSLVLLYSQPTKSQNKQSSSPLKNLSIYVCISVYVILVYLVKNKKCPLLINEHLFCDILYIKYKVYSI